MKIKNLNIKKTLKTTAVALVTGTFVLTSTIGVMPTKVEAASITQNYNAMYYFTETLQYNVYQYLNDDITSNNLNKLLGYYDTLYDFINYSKNINNTYYKNLTYAEQEELNYLLITWGNLIYEQYNSTAYFKTNCNNKLGFTLKYDSQEMGYDINHKDVMTYYTETQDKKLDDYLSKSNSESNLKNALNIYKSLANFAKGSTKSYGCYFDELTLTEQEDIIHLIENWTYSIIGEYSTYSYYERVCRSTLNYVVSVENLTRELGQYIYNDTNVNQNISGVTYNHQAAITYFTSNQVALINTYITTINDTNLASALDIYSVLWKFMKGEATVYGYYYSNLTATEKQVLIDLMIDWTTKIANAYGSNENYNTLCTEKIGWPVTLTDFNAQLTNLNQNPVVSTPVTTTPVVTVPSTNQVFTTPVVEVPQANQPSINNTIGKDWRAHYINPGINTSRGVSDYVPEDINDLNNGYNWNNQNSYGYYDQYGNFIPYNEYNQYNSYGNGYVEDYVPTLIP